MADEKLLSYIRTKREQGVPDETIRRSLSAENTPEEINGAFALLALARIPGAGTTVRDMFEQQEEVKQGTSLVQEVGKVLGTVVILLVAGVMLADYSGIPIPFLAQYQIRNLGCLKSHLARRLCR